MTVNIYDNANEMAKVLTGKMLSVMYKKMQHLKNCLVNFNRFNMRFNK